MVLVNSHIVACCIKFHAWSLRLLWLLRHLRFIPSRKSVNFWFWYFSHI